MLRLQLCNRSKLLSNVTQFPWFSLITFINLKSQLQKQKKIKRVEFRGRKNSSYFKLTAANRTKKSWAFLLESILHSVTEQQLVLHEELSILTSCCSRLWLLRIHGTLTSNHTPYLALPFLPLPALLTSFKVCLCSYSCEHRDALNRAIFGMRRSCFAHCCQFLAICLQLFRKAGVQGIEAHLVPFLQSHTCFQSKLNIEGSLFGKRERERWGHGQLYGLLTARKYCMINLCHMCIHILSVFTPKGHNIQTRAFISSIGNRQQFQGRNDFILKKEKRG